jgi:nucleoside-diphosphate-sugar epimerase
MTILITGSSGHLGEALCLTLKKQNIPFLGVDLKESKYTTHVGDVADSKFVDTLMENVEYVMHTATLHKPHVATHTTQDFIDTNISGTLNLLEAARKNNVKGFIYTSTTSTFGDNLIPAKNQPATWITEKTLPIPKNIYGVTKTAAEDLCQLYYRNHQLPCIVLKTSRFFPEEDDKKLIRDLYDDSNSKANEFLNRRVDIEDAVSAHLMAMEKMQKIGFAKYIISATSPFTKNHLEGLTKDACEVVSSIYPEFKSLYAQSNWNMNPTLDRVYVNKKARKELGWKPKYDFQHVLNCLKNNTDFNSQLSKELGIKGYHDMKFENGPYPVDKLT